MNCAWVQGVGFFLKNPKNLKILGKYCYVVCEYPKSLKNYDFFEVFPIDLSVFMGCSLSTPKIHFDLALKTPESSIFCWRLED